MAAVGDLHFNNQEEAIAEVNKELYESVVPILLCDWLTLSE